MKHIQPATREEGKAVKPQWQPLTLGIHGHNLHKHKIEAMHPHDTDQGDWGSLKGFFLTRLHYIPSTPPFLKCLDFSGPAPEHRCQIHSWALPRPSAMQLGDKAVG